jgi:hypothetical protein
MLTDSCGTALKSSLHNSMAPAVAGFGVQTIFVSFNCCSVNVALALTPLSVAVRVAGPSVAVADTVAVNVALVAPAATFMLGGIVSDAAVLDSATAVFAETAAERVTVQVVVEAAGSVVLAQETETGRNAFAIETCTVFTIPFSDAVTVTGWVTADVSDIVNVAVFAPAGTVTVDGTLAPVRFAEIATFAPPVDAAADSSTVQDVDPGAETEAGEH